MNEKTAKKITENYEKLLKKQKKLCYNSWCVGGRKCRETTAFSPPVHLIDKYSELCQKSSEKQH